MADLTPAMKRHMSEPATSGDLRALADDVEGDPSYKLGHIHAARLRNLANWLDANGGPTDAE